VIFQNWSLQEKGGFTIQFSKSRKANRKRYYFTGYADEKINLLISGKSLFHHLWGGFCMHVFEAMAMGTIVVGKKGSSEL
jgi:hypothetical protein